jgi:FAD/FMN-containing dehydrogenase
MRFARQHDLLVSVRGGGHNIAGKAVADGAFMIDLQPMKGVQVDPDARTVRVGPGASLGDLDQATQAHGLAVPVGINSTTGVAGLTLGGGFGWLSRKHGLTIDSLRSVDLVTADGQTARASAEEAPDLFWAIRGGGGNFGIVTSFEFAAHPVGPEVLCGLVVHPGDSAASLLREYRELCKSAPDELSVWMVLRKAPPLPFLPEEWHGKDVVVLPMLYAGDAEAGEKAAQPFRAMGSPIADVVGRQPFIAFETMFDPLLTPGARNYWKTHNLPELSDGAIDAIVEQAGRLPSPQCEVFLAQLGGAISRVPADATAYPGRDAAFVMNAHARWESPEEDEHCRTWARELFAAVKPFAGPGAYVNFMPEDETGRVGDAYGTHFQRLREVKKRYDPQNVFRLNQNIPPA